MRDAGGARSRVEPRRVRQPSEKKNPDWFHHHGSITDWNDPVQILSYDVHGLPDLAQEREPVYDYLLGAAKGWIARTGLDGFRLDAVKHVPLSFWRRFNEDLQARHPGLVFLGELFDGDPPAMAEVMRRGHFTHMFDFPLAFALRDVFCDDASPGRIGAILFADRVYDDPTRLVTFLDNHDLPRIMSACHDDAARVKNGLTAQLAIRGIPALSYGTEAGLEGKDEPNNRPQMRFGAAPGLAAHLRELFALRRAHPVLASGATRLLSLEGGVLLFARVGDGETILVAISGAAAPQTLSAPVWVGTRFVDLLTDAVTPLAVAPGQTRVWLAPGASAPPAASSRRVTLLVPSATPKLSLSVVGSGDELGNWTPSAGVFLAPVDGGYGVTLELPTGGLFAFKVVDQTAGKIAWEERPNRYLFVEAGAGTKRVVLEWKLGKGGRS